jgi:hypothetical protein
VDRVVVIASEVLVVAGAAVDHVIAGISFEQVIARGNAEGDRVVAAGPDDGVAVDDAAAVRSLGDRRDDESVPVDIEVVGEDADGDGCVLGPGGAVSDGRRWIVGGVDRDRHHGHGGQGDEAIAGLVAEGVVAVVVGARRVSERAVSSCAGENPVNRLANGPSRNGNGDGHE